MGTSDLPNMYPKAQGLQAQGLRKYITMNVTFLSMIGKHLCVYRELIRIVCGL